MTGEFLTEDGLGFAAGDTNLYRGINSSWPNAPDPSGRFIWFPTQHWTTPLFR